MNGNDTFRIVVGVDGSVPSRQALDWAVTEAWFRRGFIRALTAWQMPAVLAGMDEALPWSPASLEQAARDIQARALKRLNTSDVVIRGDVREGHPARVLIDASRDADLLVVGSRGLGGFTGLLLGSVSNVVVRRAACPVLVVRPRGGAATEPDVSP